MDHICSGDGFSLHLFPGGGGFLRHLGRPDERPLGANPDDENQVDTINANLGKGHTSSEHV